jgi:hypothetical protein
VAPGQANQIQGSATPDASGNFKVTLNVGTLAAGTYPVQYSYDGDAKLSSATASSTLNVTSAGPYTSQVQLTVSPNPVSVGGAITIKAWVPIVNGVVPHGNVTISEPITPTGVGITPAPIYGQGDLLADGSITFLVNTSGSSTLTVGDHMLAATFGSNDETVYKSSSSAYVRLTVLAAETEVEEPRAVLKLTASLTGRSGDDLTIALKVDNTGTSRAINSVIQQITVKTLTGTGVATIATPLPISVGAIDVGGSVVKTLTLKVPATVQRISLTETGTVGDLSTPVATFTSSQMLILGD